MNANKQTTIKQEIIYIMSTARRPLTDRKIFYMLTLYSPNKYESVVDIRRRTTELLKEGIIKETKKIIEKGNKVRELMLLNYGE